MATTYKGESLGKKITRLLFWADVAEKLTRARCSFHEKYDVATEVSAEGVMTRSSSDADGEQSQTEWAKPVVVWEKDRYRLVARLGRRASFHYWALYVEKRSEDMMQHVKWDLVLANTQEERSILIDCLQHVFKMHGERTSDGSFVAESETSE